MVRDPVCGEDLEDVEYPEVEEYKGRYYYFGALECAQEFRRNPEKYVAGREEELGVPIPEYARKD
ncbi:MAG: YHS domain-containing protein [Armatimonadetes bacterium]|nr:YHS domain-containing protein [Armatimonadota bacterium]